MVQVIQGGIAKDQRGQIRFVNDFDMENVKRFYLIQNKDLNLIRGWRAHKIEQRWFYVLSGRFNLAVVQIDDWSCPSKHLLINEIIMDSEENKLIHIPAGYGTAIRALDVDNELLVFADYDLDHSQYDDYTYNLDYFVNYNSK
ncbi:WxcM-like domain-containing protein [Sphingobacterium sp.]|uniref:WxcM-like domain-containing protein n=1 Tax=Sphingobacterium sp. TaxID=341027 RepID=UPI0028A969FD|nr:WxcM-like domain-containing protein [Sphingobacterium sp.]